MNQDWQNFLASQGAYLQDGVINHFKSAAAELLATRDATVLCDLGQFGILRVSGADAETFLQNLCSNDIKQVSTQRAQYSSLNSAKGRMLCSMLIWRDEADYLLQLPIALCEPIRKKLSMYVLRAQVKISDASEQIIRLGLSGGHAQDVLQQHFGAVPQQQLEVLATASASVLRIDATRFQVSTTAAQAASLWAALQDRAVAVGSVCWDWLNIRAGIPLILPHTQEQFVAQMVNFDLIGGINFKKGCYPGQEIVARTHYLGKLKRRMFLAHLDTLTPTDSATPPSPGDELFSAEMEAQACGMLVNTAPAPAGGYDVLAVVQISSRESQTLHWKSQTGEALEFLPLPYAVPLA